MEVDSRKIIKRPKDEGFELISIKGSHHKFRKGQMIVIVPHPMTCRLAQRAQLPSRRDGFSEARMRYYIAVVHKDPNSAYGVHFPDVPGVFSAADEMDNLVSNAAEALALYAEDTALPAPRGIDDIRKDREIVKDMAEGAFLVAVPFIENDARVERINVTMEAGLLRAVDEAAKVRKLTRSAFLAQAARHEIEQ